MCIIFFAKNVHADYPLIIAANRDEYFARPTQEPHWWSEAPHLFAGKDLQAGGTWLGHNRQNRIAGITNLRRPDLYRSDAKSRGDLVKRFLDIDTEDTDEAIAEFTCFLKEDYSQYNPFNLLFGDTNKLVIFSSATGVAEEVEDGVHGLSNGAPNEIWPKIELGTERLNSYLSSNRQISSEELFSILTDETRLAHESLSKRSIPLNIEYLLSSIYIPEFELNGSPYGTRSSSVLWINNVSDDGVIMHSRLYT